MTEDAVGAFRAAAFHKEAAGTVVVKFAFIALFTLPCQIGLAQFDNI